VTQTLPINRYHFTVRALQPLRLPDYAGSMLRGTFGHALRKVACMTRMKECGGCPLLATCPYSQIFETPPERHALQKFSKIPNPYVIEPPEGGARVLAAGESFTFNMVLMGKALPQLPLIILAWERALGGGLGKTSPSRCELVSVHSEGDDEAIYTSGGKIRGHHHARADTSTLSSEVALEFTTPLRLQKLGNNVGLRELDARTLLIALARRYQLLCDTQLENSPQADFAALSAAAQQIRIKADMHWHDWERYSNRQQQAMKLGGLRGRLELTGDLSPFAQLLALGQWLHVGKETVFGLGRYRVDQPVPSRNQRND